MLEAIELKKTRYTLVLRCVNVQMEKLSERALYFDVDDETSPPSTRIAPSRMFRGKKGACLFVFYY